MDGPLGGPFPIFSKHPEFGEFILQQKKDKMQFYWIDIKMKLPRICYDFNSFFIILKQIAQFFFLSNLLLCHETRQLLTSTSGRFIYRYSLQIKFVWKNIRFFCQKPGTSGAINKDDQQYLCVKLMIKRVI